MGGISSVASFPPVLLTCVVTTLVTTSLGAPLNFVDDEKNDIHKSEGWLKFGFLTNYGLENIELKISIIY